MAKTTCLSWCVMMWRKWMGEGDWSDFGEHVVRCAAHFSVYHCNCWSMTSQPSLLFTGNDPRERKYPMSSSCVGVKCLVDVRGQSSRWAECRKTTVAQVWAEIRYTGVYFVIKHSLALSKPVCYLKRLIIVHHLLKVMCRPEISCLSVWSQVSLYQRL